MCSQQNMVRRSTSSVCNLKHIHKVHSFNTGNEFPATFESQYIRKMVRLLFHVLAHVYHSHFKEIVLLQLHAHLNALFAHFVGFSVRFNLLEEKELEVAYPFPILPSTRHIFSVYHRNG